MKPQGETANVIRIMNHFSCDKKMAELIIKSYKANGDYESIERLCQEERKLNK